MALSPSSIKEYKKRTDSVVEKFSGQIQSLYKNLESFDGEQEKLYKFFKTSVPKGDSRKELGYLIGERKKVLSDLRRTLNDYKMEVKQALPILSEEYGQDAVNMHVRGTSGISHAAEKKKAPYIAKLTEYKQRILRLSEKLNDIDSTIKADVEHYTKKADKGPSMGGNIVALAMVAVFGGTVLYALSQLSPGSMSTGNFFLAGSPTLLAMLSGVVVFVLFFLTHHKFK